MEKAIMKEMINHILGTCGENHLSVLTIMSSGIAILYKDYIIRFFRWIGESYKEL